MNCFWGEVIYIPDHGGSFPGSVKVKHLPYFSQRSKRKHPFNNEPF
jgi:hypothetical protein